MTADLKLVTLKTFAAEVNAEVVAVLQEALERAQNGELAAVAIASVRSDKMTATTRFAKSDCLPALLGAVAILNRRLTADCE